MVNLRKYDLNLLVVLDALLDEVNVTRAGKRIHLSQSATSAALERLRIMFGDPLLVRVEGGMELTLLAQELRAPLKHLLVSIGDTVKRPGGFDPATSTAVFRIGMTDYLGLILLPELHARLSAEAPQIRLEVIPVSQDRLIAMIERDQVDVAGAVSPADRPHVLHKTLLHETFSFVCHRDHPAASSPLDLATLLRFPHVNVVAHGDAASSADLVFSRMGVMRNVRLSMPYFAAAFALLKQSDLVAILPSRLARRQATTYGLSVHEMPFEIPGYSLELCWHLRTDNHPAHAWFRQMLLDIARD
jgi:DNA-binding transcriptional LysR family regulator